VLNGVIVLVHERGSLTLLLALLLLLGLLVLVNALKCLHLTLADEVVNLLLSVVIGLLSLVICIRVILLMLTLGTRTVVDQLLTNVDILVVGVDLDTLELLSLPLALAFGFLLLAASLLLLVLLLSGFALLLLLLALGLTLGLLLLVPLIAGLALDIGLLGLLKPHDVLNELLLDLVLDHLGVVSLASGELISLDLGNSFANTSSLVVDLLKLLGVAEFVVVDLGVLLLHFVDLGEDRAQNLVDLGQL